MSDLLALAERVEDAMGPDRELDAEIAASVRYFPSGVGFVWQSSLTPNSPDTGRVECCTNIGTGGPHYNAPAYTASLDAAMTLVPPGKHWTGQTDSDGAVMTVGKADSDARGIFYTDCKQATAWTPALALCAAALRARAGEQS